MTVRVISVERFEPAHLAEITVQAAQRELDGDPIARGKLLASTGRCFTIRPVSGGAPILCCGALETHAEYATLWAAFSEDAGSAMLAITRRTRRFIDMLPHKRIDAIVRSDFRAAHRWVDALGFKVEARLNDYFEDGGDAVIYRVRK